jgi:hypothetical protein
MAERTHTAALLTVISDNTRALTALEAGQRTVVHILERLAWPRRGAEVSGCQGVEQNG